MFHVVLKFVAAHTTCVGNAANVLVDKRAHKDKKVYFSDKFRRFRFVKQ